MSLEIDEHRHYLADAVRLDAFAHAIAQTVRPGDVVLDLASGTGILGLLACRAGAARVYSVEVGALIEVARAVARDCGYADRVRFVRGHSTEVELPERVDVVVADQIGNFGFNAGVVGFYADARRRFLKPEGRLLPPALELHVALVDSPALDAQVSFWSGAPGGFDFAAVGALAENTGYQVDLGTDGILGDPARLATIELGSPVAPIHAHARLDVARGGVLRGLGGWFSAELASGVTLTNSPLALARIRRRQVFLPLRPALEVRPGDRVAIDMTIRPDDALVSWRATIEHADGRREATSTHSSWKGMLVSREDLARTRPDSVPVLNPRGEARRTVVDLCDGRHTLREIEQAVAERHPALFETPAKAAEFVAEVVTRYAR